MTAKQVRPGLYLTFIEKAVEQISGGARGIVALPLKTYEKVNAKERTFYTVKTEADAIDKFGEANIASIRRALLGGASEVLVYTLPTIDGIELTEAAAYDTAREQFETHPFHVFVLDGEVSAAEQDATKAWLQEKRDEGKHFFFVTGGSRADDKSVETGNTRTVRLQDDYVINLVNGMVEDGKIISSGEYATFIAGLVAGTPINKSVTYTELPVEDVSKRLRKTEIEAALTAGSFVAVHDGELVRVESGITTSGKKIRAMSSRQAVATDIRQTANRNFIGKLDNTVDSRKALMASITAYLERLQDENVLTDIVVKEDDQNPSVGDTVNLLVSYLEIDSMEKINIGVIL